MTTANFWADGPREHRRSLENQIALLRKQLENSRPDDREQIVKEIESAEQELRKCDDGQILW